MADEKTGLYLIQFSKVTSALGEQINITKNLPADSTEDDIGAEIVKMGNALYKRMLIHNADVKRRAGKSLEEMGIDPGTIYEGQEEASDGESNSNPS
jgi:hypothetical protein